MARLTSFSSIIAPAGQAKLLRSLRGRRGIRERYRVWGRAGRDDSRPLVWLHAPSVGEGLQARPVLDPLRAERPDLQLAYTFFSPSAESFARGLNVDFRDYLPFDSTADSRVALEALRPRALVFSKLDVWPVLTREAKRRGVRVGLISATLARASSRQSRLARSLLRDAYASLDAVGAIGDDDAARLSSLGARHSAITVTGDTRYDQVWARAGEVDRSAALLGPLASDRPTLVAGSTWPADELRLLTSWTAVRRAVPGARLILAPHEPTPRHLEPIDKWAAEASISLARLGTGDAKSADVIVVDRVGVLGDLYALADVAYVGGGFHDAGLHSVIEPAAFGAPVLFGPRFATSRDASLLLAAGGAAAVTSGAELTERLTLWLSSVAERRAAGATARDLVRRGVGAAERTLALVRSLL